MAAKRLVGLALAIGVAAVAAAATPQIVHRGCTRPGCLCTIPNADYQYKTRSRSETAVSLTALLLRKNTSLVDAAVIPSAIREEVSQQSTETRRYDPQKGQITVRRQNQETINNATPLTTEQHNRGQDRLEVLPVPTNSPDPLHPNPVHVDDHTSLTDRFTSLLPAPRIPQKTVVDLYQLDRDNLLIDQCEISQVALQLHDNGHWVLSLRADQNRQPPSDQKAVFNPRLYIKRNQFVVRLRCLGDAAVKSGATLPASGKPVLVELNPAEFWVENGQPRYVRTGGNCTLVRDYFVDIDRVEIEFFYR
ncbi:MAG: hypothetical protein NTY19_06395 [Planctomycetota bacterium]|nr:hypothetical protein [Planctomycetota bacterium]